MQNQDKTEIILSVIRFCILNTLNDFYTCLKHANIPSHGGEFRGTKKPLLPPIFFSYMVLACFQDNQLTIIVMSLVSSRHTPEKQEYFQSSTDRVYKVCRRYFIQQKTLETFGIKFDQGKWALPKVMEYDSMLSNPDGQIKNEVDKPFCCTHCGSESYIKYGKENNKQMYKCKDCNRKFVDNMYFEKLKADPNTICLVLDLYFKGVSLRKIADHLKQFHKINVYHTTVLRWIERYIEIMDKYVSQFKPKLGTVWHADEMMVSVDGDWFYLWNVMDEFTRFHLASVISKERKTENARKAFQVAKKRSHNDKPRCVVTDGLQSYNKAINKEFHTVKKETIHIGNTGIRGKCYKDAKFYNNIVERLNGTVRDRNKTQRGLEKQDSVFIKGHQLYYNFIRPHEGLNGYTPRSLCKHLS